MEGRIPQPLHNMNNKYFLHFNYDWDVSFLLDVYEKQKAEGMTVLEKSKFRVADLSQVDKTKWPLFELMEMQRITNNCMLGEITERIGLHCNPKNNGLVILPLRGTIDFNFYSWNPPLEDGLTSFMPYDTNESVEKTLTYAVRGVSTPFAFNGRLIHDYWPTSNSAIFFALKIPLACEWDKTGFLLNDR